MREGKKWGELSGRLSNKERGLGTQGKKNTDGQTNALEQSTRHQGGEGETLDAAGLESYEARTHDVNGRLNQF